MCDSRTGEESVMTLDLSRVRIFIRPGYTDLRKAVNPFKYLRRVFTQAAQMNPADDWGNDCPGTSPHDFSGVVVIDTYSRASPASVMIPSKYDLVLGVSPLAQGYGKPVSDIFQGNQPGGQVRLVFFRGIFQKNPFY
jgi:hypothetical protein